MTSAPSTSCVRCQKPLAVESATGLCTTCFLALETLESTPIPADPNLTATLRVDRGMETRTGGFEVDGQTGTWDEEARLRKAPDGYQILRFLGRGGMGDVYLAREIAPDRILAMKFLRAVTDPNSARRFEEEIRALARIEHPNIVRVISVELYRPDPFFTMEYAAGGTLSEKVKAAEGGALPPEEATGIAIVLARAAQAAHDVAIIHRDLKPGNILFTADGIPKIGDFGLAKRLDEDTERDPATMASSAVGTPPFMPPEGVSRVKHGDFTVMSDVYGLGATLYFMVTGRPPFTGDAHDVMRQVEREAPPRPRSLRPELPLGLEAVVLKCLEKKPADRYATAEEMATDLERKKPKAPRMTWWRRLKMWLGRNRMALAAAGAVISIGAVVAMLREPEPNPVPPIGVSFPRYRLLSNRCGSISSSFSMLLSFLRNLRWPSMFV